MQKRTKLRKLSLNKEVMSKVSGSTWHRTTTRCHYPNSKGGSCIWDSCDTCNCTYTCNGSWCDCTYVTCGC